MDLARVERPALAVGVNTTRLPSSSMPCASPASALRAGGPGDPRGRGAHRARGRPPAPPPGAGLEPAGERARAAPPARLRGRPRRRSRCAARWRSRAARAGSSSAVVSTFSPMPITAQPSCGRASIRMPATLRPSIQTSLGHLIGALHRRHALACLADRHRHRERQQRERLVAGAHDDRQRERPPRWCDPAASLAAAAGGLLLGQHDRACRRAARAPAPARDRWSSRSRRGGPAARRAGSARRSASAPPTRSARPRRRDAAPSASAALPPLSATAIARLESS